MEHLFHRILPGDDLNCVFLEEVQKNGLNANSKSNQHYMNVSKLNPELFQNKKPKETPNWVDFSKAIGVDLVPKYSEMLSFPVFTEKILVFDKDITFLIYDQDMFDRNNGIIEEVQNFDTGEAMDVLMQRYWDSMITLQDYLKKGQYKNPEVLLYEPVPYNIIKIICE